MKFYEAHFNLGNVLLDRGDHLKAIECYIQAVKINPNSTDAFKKLSNIFSKVAFKGPNPDLEELIISIFNIKTIIKINISILNSITHRMNDFRIKF